jgi:hypothetical protein
VELRLLSPAGLHGVVLDLAKGQILLLNIRWSTRKSNNFNTKGKGKGKAVPLQARCGPEGSRRFGLSHFHDIRHMKVVRLSA